MSNSKRSNRSRALAAAAVVSGGIALAACGGGNNDPVPGSQPGPAEAVPVSATTSVSGLITYLLALTAIQDDTLKPVDVSNITLPVDDTAPPTPLM